MCESPFLLIEHPNTEYQVCIFRLDVFKLVHFSGIFQPSQIWNRILLYSISRVTTCWRYYSVVYMLYFKPDIAAMLSMHSLFRCDNKARKCRSVPVNVLSRYRPNRPASYDSSANLVWFRCLDGRYQSHTRFDDKWLTNETPCDTVVLTKYTRLTRSL